MTNTAVEWLVEKHFGGIDNCTPDFRYHIKQAKEMEKQQIIESYCQGCFDISLNKNIFPRETSEQYYKETFKK
jgi:hypothetical protein